MRWSWYVSYCRPTLNELIGHYNTLNWCRDWCLITLIFLIIIRHCYLLWVHCMQDLEKMIKFLYYSPMCSVVYIVLDTCTMFLSVERIPLWQCILLLLHLLIFSFHVINWTFAVVLIVSFVVVCDFYLLLCITVVRNFEQYKWHSIFLEACVNYHGICKTFRFGNHYTLLSNLWHKCISSAITTCHLQLDFTTI